MSNFLDSISNWSADREEVALSRRRQRSRELARNQIGRRAAAVEEEVVVAELKLNGIAHFGDSANTIEARNATRQAALAGEDPLLHDRMSLHNRTTSLLAHDFHIELAETLRREGRL